MAAIYGIFGEADLSEVDGMGARLAHRGAMGQSWSVTERVHFGMRSDGGPGGRPEIPVLFDGLCVLPPEGGSAPAVSAGGEECARRVFDLFRREGPEGFRHLQTPFALALWDDREGRLLLATDTLGVKMLYHTTDRHGRRLFASEYKALLALESVAAAPNRDAIDHVHRTKYAMTGETCVSGVRSLLPGSWLEFGRSGIRTARYRHLRLDTRDRPDEEHAAALEESLLRAAGRVAARSERIGIALSSGVDSVAALAAIRRVAPEKEIHSFTAGLDSDGPTMRRARRVAGHFRTTHHEFTMSANELPDLISNTLWRMEEPTGREERLLYYVIARSAAPYVHTVVTGHGSDTLFGGMPRHLVASLAFRIPALRRPLAEFYNCTQVGRLPSSPLGRILVARYFKGGAHPLSKVLGSNWRPRTVDLLRTSPEPLSEHLKEGMSRGPFNAYATEKIMAGSAVEVISPFWAGELMQCAFQIPDRLKIRGLRQKYLLSEVLARFLPRELQKRQKDFIRIIHDPAFSDALERIAADVLSPDAVAERGLFEPSYVADARTRPRGGVYPMPRFYNLWSLVLIELWCRFFLDGRGAPLVRPL